MRRASILLLTWTLLVLTVSLGGATAYAFEPRAAALVLALPVLLVGLHVGPRALAGALAMAFAARPGELAAESRAHSAAHLRMLGGLSIAVGLLGFFAGTVGLINRTANTGGQANPYEVLGGLGALLLAPVYGLLLKALLYDPLAAGLEEADSGLGNALEASAAGGK